MNCYRNTMLIGLCIIAGCNGLPSQLHSDDEFLGRLTVRSGFPLPYLFQGSAVQWNRDYAVSVRHIPFISDIAYRCSTGCDLVFIRRKAIGAVPHWRTAAAGEPVVAVGFSPLMMPLKGEGKALNIKLRLSGGGDPTAYAVHDGPIVQGMSGGPVYGSDGAVLGMTIGMLFGGAPAFGELRSSERLSLYVPYEIVRQEWDTFSRTR